MVLFVCFLVYFLFLSIFSSVHLFIVLSAHQPRSLCLSHFLSVLLCLCVSVSLSLCLSVVFSHFEYLTFCLWLCLTLCLPISLPTCVLSVPTSVYLSFSSFSGNTFSWTSVAIGPDFTKKTVYQFKSNYLSWKVKVYLFFNS
jgi:hypothetical protein